MRCVQRGKKSTGAEARRKQVQILRRQGHNPSAIAKILNVSRATVIKDIEELTNQARTTVKEAGSEASQSLVDALKVWDDIIENARIGFQSASNPSVKNAFLKTMGAANSARMRLMMDLGILKRAPIKSDVLIEGVQIEKASTEDLAGLLRSLRSRALAKGLSLEAVESLPELHDESEQAFQFEDSKKDGVEDDQDFFEETPP